MLKQKVFFGVFLFGGWFLLFLFWVLPEGFGDVGVPRMTDVWVKIVFLAWGNLPVYFFTCLKKNIQKVCFTKKRKNRITECLKSDLEMTAKAVLRWKCGNGSGLLSWLSFQVLFYIS